MSVSPLASSEHGRITLTRERADRSVERALARHKRGQIASAYRVYRAVLARFPDHAAATHYLGLIAQQTGDARAALCLLHRSIQLDPSDPRTYNHLGQVVLAQNGLDAAARCFEQALAVDPSHVESLNNLANVTALRGDPAGAVELYLRALRIEPRSSHAAYNLANKLRELRRFDAALHWFERAIEIDPHNHHAYHNCAVLLEEQGRFDAAIEHYLAVLRIQPEHVKALANLLALRAYRPDRPTIEHIEALLSHPGPDDDERIKLHHAYGKHLDRTGEYERAFEHFASANRIQQRRRGVFDIAPAIEYFDRIIAAFPADRFERSPRGSDTRRPVFVVGMPRSGTTLVEQILASHPDVFGAGELPEIPALARSLSVAYPEGMAAVDARELARCAERYLSVLAGLAPDSVLRVIDKLPVNFTHLGLIALLFPGAHVIHCRRDPLDVGLSCFIEQFDMRHDFTTDLQHFGQYFLQYERLMAHWCKVLPLHIHEQRYERLIAEPLSQARALLEHCGLPWRESCLDFHRTQRTVLTPSRWQVRQPLYRSSIARWRHYASHMTPLQSVLQAQSYQYAATT